MSVVLSCDAGVVCIIADSCVAISRFVLFLIRGKSSSIRASNLSFLDKLVCQHIFPVFGLNVNHPSFPYFDKLGILYGL